jgi:hypothetical protein
MDIEELEEQLEEIFGNSYSLETNHITGEVIIRTGLQYSDDGDELVPLEDQEDDEEDPDFDPDFEPLEDEDDEEE